jgi:hypothetical protein
MWSNWLRPLIQPDATLAGGCPGEEEDDHPPTGEQRVISPTHLRVWV